MKFLLIGVLFFLISCGESPLFNHRLENNNLIQDTFRSESDVQKFEKSGYSFVISWVEGPQMGGSRFILKTWKNGIGTARALPGFTKSFECVSLDANHSHGSAPVKIRKLTNGEYEVSDVQFIMAGKWEIKFQLKDGLQVVDEVIIPVSL